MEGGKLLRDEHREFLRINKQKILTFRNPKKSPTRSTKIHFRRVQVKPRDTKDQKSIFREEREKEYYKGAIVVAKEKKTTVNLKCNLQRISQVTDVFRQTTVTF